MNYIDLHSHLAWDIDDGISSIEDCQRLLSVAHKDHIEKIVATPHLICGKHDAQDIVLFENRINELKELAQDYGIEIYKGSELFLNDMLFQNLNTKQLMPIADSRYVLCEFNVRKQYDEDYELITDYLYEITVAGYIPILAHVERYFRERIDLSAIKNLVDMGCYMQMNTSSILYPKSQAMKKNIFDLLNHNLVHIIATDSHHYKGNRSPNMDAAYTYLCKHFDKTNLEKLFYQNPLAVISDTEISATNFKKHILSARRFFK